MIRVTREIAGAAGGEEHFDGATVFAAEIVEVGDVVVCLGDE